MNTLVAYFSRPGNNCVDGKVKYLEKGNTEIVANMIACVNELETFRIEPVDKGPEDFYEYLDYTQKELNNKHFPKLLNNITNKVDVLYLGFPNYWGTMPRAVFSFLKELDDSNLIIYPFITHNGGEFGRSLEDIKDLCPHATIESPLSINSEHIKCQLSVVEKWANERKS